ncbi:MAG: hypothetical protein QM820_40315 [Minicystis sp.]
MGSAGSGFDLRSRRALAIVRLRERGRGRRLRLVGAVVVLGVDVDGPVDRAHLRHDRAEDPGVAALVEARDRSLPGEAEPGPGRHLVAFNQSENLLDPFALRGGDHEIALGRGGAGAKIDDAQGAVPPVDQEAQGHGIILKKELFDPAGRGARAGFGGHHPPWRSLRGCNNAAPSFHICNGSYQREKLSSTYS